MTPSLELQILTFDLLETASMHNMHCTFSSPLSDTLLYWCIVPYPTKPFYHIATSDQ